MQEISAIIRDVIIIIVAATFIELLLPRSEFHRYIRMVVGLLIILVLLTSVQDFLRLAPPGDSGLFFSQFRQTDAPLETEEDFFYQRLEAEYRARVEAEAERVALEAAQSLTAVKAQVTLQDDGKFSFQVASLKLYLRGGETREGVEILPVIIELSPTPPSTAKTSLLSREGLEVQEHVARHFQLQEGQVEIIFVDG